MSANLLQQAGKLNTLTDDLESFLHVLAWMMLRYVPASDDYDAEDRGRDMLKFNEHSIRKRRFDHGGDRKCDALGRGSYPSVVFRPRTPTPLCDLLTELTSPFKSLYAVRPPTAEDREKVNVPKSKYDHNLEDLSVDIRRYDRHIEQLQSSSWFINQIQEAFNRQDWPADDKADETLPIDFSGGTRRQVQNKNDQLRNTNSLWESSKGLSRSSKRAASPTPESSAKRRRGTHAVSATQS